MVREPLKLVLLLFFLVLLLGGHKVFEGILFLALGRLLQGWVELEGGGRHKVAFSKRDVELLELLQGVACEQILLFGSFISFKIVSLVLVPVDDLGYVDSLTDFLQSVVKTFVVVQNRTFCDLQPAS